MIDLADTCEYNTTALTSNTFIIPIFNVLMVTVNVYIIGISDNWYISTHCNVTL